MGLSKPLWFFYVFFLYFTNKYGWLYYIWKTTRTTTLLRRNIEVFCICFTPPSQLNSSFSFHHFFLHSKKVYHSIIELNTNFFICYSTDPKLSVTFTSSNTTAPMRINNLNVWNTVLSDHQILYMSYTCGREKGNVVEWAEFLKIINTTTTPAGDMTHYSSTSCTGRQGRCV